jgi:hypothetical protein
MLFSESVLADLKSREEFALARLSGSIDQINRVDQVPECKAAPLGFGSPIHWYPRPSRRGAIQLVGSVLTRS